MRRLSAAPIYVAILLFSALSFAADTGGNYIIRVPVMTPFSGFSWGPLYENARHDLIVSYAYVHKGQRQEHYFDIARSRRF